MRELLDAVARMLRLLDRPSDAPVLAPMIEREIIWRLLTGPQGDTIRQIGLADSDLSHVSRAIGWIRDNYAEPMRIDDLARLSGMSASAFHRHFRAVTAMSPLQFQKRIRLQEARSLLVARPGDVAGIGHLVGYDSPSQFNREYRRLFGSPPGQDAARHDGPGDSCEPRCKACLRGHRVVQPRDVGGRHDPPARLAQGPQRLRDALQIRPLRRMGDEVGPNRALGVTSSGRRW